MPQTRQHMQRRVNPERLRHGWREDTGVRLTPEGIEQFLEACRTEGRTEGTIQLYRRGLKRLYEALPEDKTIRRGTLECWREKLVAKGYAPGTINGFLTIANTYLDFVGHREYQLASQLKLDSEVQPELTRTEYLRLLQTARLLGRERVYLLVKLFGSMGLSVQDLDKVTCEAVEAGKVTVGKQILRFPEGLRRELLDYAERNGYLRGPVFLTREGMPMSRTTVTLSIRRLCETAQVPEEKCNPRCLKRLYQVTRSGIEENVALLVEQAHCRLLEREQLEIGWEK